MTLVGVIDAVVLSGGSLYGLDAAGGVSAVLCAQGKGASFGGIALPVAVQAILFDLTNGGDKDWLTHPVEQRPPYWELGRDAALAAAEEFALGTVGRRLRRHHGQRSRAGWARPAPERGSGFIVGALAAVNAVGIGDDRRRPHFWAAPYEQGSEFGGHGCPAKFRPRRWPSASRASRRRSTATTIAWSSPMRR